MCVYKTVALLIAVLAATPTASLAADMAARPPVITAESVVPDETGAGWYLRGDIGYASNVAPSMSWQTTSYSGNRAANSGTFDFGLGYRFTENLRSDVTLDFLTSHRVLGALNATTTDTLNQDMTAGLVNGYYDIGKFMGITPYIGAGIGAARINADQLTRSVNGTTTYVFNSASNYTLAAAATTGFSFDIGHGLQADLGYKFAWFGNSTTGLESTSHLTGKVNIGNSTAHELRFGLKYFIN